MEIYWMIAIVIVGLIAFISGWLSNKKIGQAKVANAEKMAEKIIKLVNIYRYFKKYIILNLTVLT